MKTATRKAAVKAARTPALKTPIMALTAEQKAPVKLLFDLWVTERDCMSYNLNLVAGYDKVTNQVLMMEYQRLTTLRDLLLAPTKKSKL